MTRPLRLLPFLLPLLVGLYVPFLGGGFLTDDFVHLDRLAGIDNLSTLVTTPDAIGFYRPVTQASLKLDTIMFGHRGPGFRAVNVAIHASVIAAAFVVARLTLTRTLAATLATIAFALTPKAHPIAVMWVSGRGELLMALFSLIACAAWIVWSRNGRTWWLVLATSAYVAALLSKESALLLPLLLLVTPAATRPWKSRLAATFMLVAIAAAVLALRTSVGALTPFSTDAHYNLVTPLTRWARSARNYAGRMAPAPLAFIVLVGAAGLFASRRMSFRLKPPLDFARGGPEHVEGPEATVVFSFVWMLVFLAPVLPLVLRSEIYLYMPVFGACLLAGLITESLIRGVESHWAVVASIALCVVSLGTYQAFRDLGHHRDLDFSAKFVSALEARRDLAGQQALIAVVPADTVTERFLKDTIDGTFRAVLHLVFGGEPRGIIEYSGTAPTQGAIRLSCEYRSGQLTLRTAH